LGEVAKGVFVSHPDTEEWEADEETGGWVHFLRSDDHVEAGLWKPDPATAGQPVSVVLPDNQTIVILRGNARIAIVGGPTLELKPGDVASFSKGAKTTWTVTPTFMEFWVYN
jgi:uncharacterized cupin superfamily protein